MNKPLVALASAASVGLVALAPINANAGCFGCAVGLGILGGVAAGAIVGSAIANSPPPPPPGYYPPPPAGYPRERDDRDDEIARLKSKVGEITMDNELLQTRLETL